VKESQTERPVEWDQARVNGHTVETLAGCAGGALRCRLPPDVLGSLLRRLAAVSWDLLEPRGLSLTS
jgi:hypothetical protein